MSGDQSNAAAERSAHVERGPARRIPGEAFLSEVSPGVFQLKAVAELRAALKACADDLEAEVCARYAGTQDLYPSERRRFERDMEAVTAARQLLAGGTS